LRADGFIIRAQAAIRTDGFTSVQGFAEACALRAPTTFNLYGYKPSVQIERGSSGKPAQGEEDADVSGTHFKMRKTVYPESTDRFSSVRGFAS
jgi:hypothetical protein